MSQTLSNTYAYMNSLNVAQWLFPSRAPASFAQCGEDRIVAFLAQAINLRITSYFDIGAHAPVEGSNTYLFYREGAKGVCVEPTPSLARDFARLRPKDTVLAKAVVSSARRVKFHVLDPPTLSTLDDDACARALRTPGSKLVETIDAEAITLNDLFLSYGVPDFLSVDVEGGDLDLLKGWDMSRFRPPILCFEDLEYSHERVVKRSLGVTDYLVSHDYMAFADTFINSILVDRSRWHG
jgi:FkbM family methyltransferase